MRSDVLEQISSFLSVCTRWVGTSSSILLAHFHFMIEENMNIIEKFGIASIEHSLLHKTPRILTKESVLYLNLMVFNCKESSTKKPFTHLQTPSPSSEQAAGLTTLLPITTWYSCRQVPLRHREKNKWKRNTSDWLKFNGYIHDWILRRLCKMPVLQPRVSFCCWNKSGYLQKSKLMHFGGLIGKQEQWASQRMQQSKSDVTSIKSPVSPLHFLQSGQAPHKLIIWHI